MKMKKFRKKVQVIKDAGTTLVHRRIASLPIIKFCYYGVDTPSTEEFILHRMSIEETQKLIAADSLVFSSSRPAPAKDKEDEELLDNSVTLTLHSGPPNINNSLENTALSCKVDNQSGANCFFTERRDKSLQETEGRVPDGHAKKLKSLGGKLEVPESVCVHMEKREKKLVVSVTNGVSNELRCKRLDGKAWHCSTATIPRLSLFPKHHQSKSNIGGCKKKKKPSPYNEERANKRAKAMPAEASNFPGSGKKRKRKAKEKNGEVEERDSIPPKRDAMKSMRVIEEEEPHIMKKFVPTGLMEIPVVIDGGRDVVPDELHCKRPNGKQWRCGARAMPECSYIL